MGREIRRVPPNWEHPKAEMRWGYDYKPLLGRSYREELAEWLEGYRLWELGNHPDQENPKIKAMCQNYAEWAGDPPSVDRYRPEWAEGEATWYQVYETVSEGTPVTPPFATQDELIDYLSTYGDFWNQKYKEPAWSYEAATIFVKGSGWLPSGAMLGGQKIDLTQQPLS